MLKKQTTGTLPALNMGMGRLPGVQRPAPRTQAGTGETVYFGPRHSPQLTVDSTGTIVSSPDSYTLYRSAIAENYLGSSPRYGWRMTIIKAIGVVQFGVATQGIDWEQALGNDVHGYCYDSIGQRGHSGGFTTVGSGFTIGDQVDFAFNSVTGELWVAVNGSWLLGGNPETGATPFLNTIPNYAVIACGMAAGCSVKLIAGVVVSPSYAPV